MNNGYNELMAAIIDLRDFTIEGLAGVRNALRDEIKEVKGSVEVMRHDMNRRFDSVDQRFDLFERRLTIVERHTGLVS